MNNPETDQSAIPLRDYCHGELPLPGRVDRWMLDVLESACLPYWVEQFDSPLNIVFNQPMRENVGQLLSVAKQRDLDFQIFFARKSNKCLTFVDAAIDLGIGVDVASQNELEQTLGAGIDSEMLICTAAIKSTKLVDRCIADRIVIAVDNSDELNLIAARAGESNEVARIAIRLGGFIHRGSKLPTRFGFDVDRDQAIVDRLAGFPVHVLGVHFHLDGSDAAQRVDAIFQSLQWVERLRERGHQPTFVDIGGGFPMSYLVGESQWHAFWEQLRAALRSERQPITYRNHGLGLVATESEIVGATNIYPHFRQTDRSDWLADILDSQRNGRTIAETLQQQNVQLRCEPGRSLLDRCGMTIARVEFCKENADGDSLIGLSMNRTQCRTTSDDFLVDPLLIPNRHTRSRSPMSGFLVGAYCTESELISLRRFVFPHGVARGDLFVFPNTAGYLMHFLESRSHQFPLARNLCWSSADQAVKCDPIDDA